MSCFARARAARADAAAVRPGAMRRPALRPGPLLAIVLTGLFSSAHLAKYSYFPTAAPPTCRVWNFILFRGQVEIKRHDYPPASAVLSVIGDSYEFGWEGYSVPGSGAIAGFAAGVLPPSYYRGPPGSSAYRIAFPVWPLAVPFLIAPA